ncbi:DNA-protecting protein DprA [Candidatus Roizmanbacteria bacterium]|nr:DNA-protecting protein DprA [Candidatus Roizmanbacteria bacterium]
MVDADEVKYLIGLSFFEGIGPVRYRVLKSYFGSAKAIFSASNDELRQTGIGTQLVEKFTHFRDAVDLSSYQGELTKKGVRVITEKDSEYPKLLRETSAAPFILYALGDTTLLKHELKLAVVGTRRPTSYGIQVTKTFARELAAAGYCIVSGMAMGVDAVAHMAALDALGSTIAVLGCGVDICYPAVNRGVYQQLIKRGLILSEFPPGTRTSKGVFPSRNRIVAGLCRGVVVTEGARDSGSLITAGFALDFGRDVFAVPGPITSQMSEAPTELLKHGAKPVARTIDILEEYEDTRKKQSVQSDALLSTLTDEERIVVRLVAQEGSLHIDELVRKIDQSPALTFSIISALEIRGILEQVASGTYSIGIGKHA